MFKKMNIKFKVYALNRRLNAVREERRNARKDSDLMRAFDLIDLEVSLERKRTNLMRELDRLRYGV